MADATKVQVVAGFGGEVLYTGERDAFKTVADLQLAVEKASQVPVQQQQLLLEDKELSGVQDLAEALGAPGTDAAMITLVKLRPALPLMVVARVGNITGRGSMGSWCYSFEETRRLFLSGLEPETTLKELILQVAQELLQSGHFTINPDLPSFQPSNEELQALHKFATEKDEASLVRRIRILASPVDAHDGSGMFGPLSSPSVPWSSMQLVPLSELEKRTVGELEEAQQEPNSEMDFRALEELARAFGINREKVFDVLRNIQDKSAQNDEIRKMIQSVKSVDDAPDKVSLRKVKFLLSEEAPEENPSCCLQ